MRDRRRFRGVDYLWLAINGLGIDVELFVITFWETTTAGHLKWVCGWVLFTFEDF